MSDRTLHPSRSRIKKYSPLAVGRANDRNPGEVNLCARFTMKMISHEANGLQIAQRRQDGYINATQMCKANNKEWRYYWRLPNTQKYVKALAEDLGIDVIVNNPTCNNYASALVLTFRGGNSQQGTWVHPEVAIDLAAWISVEFRILVNRWVREWMSNGNNPITPTVTQIDPKIVLALAELEKSIISVRSHARVIHNCVHQPIDELLAKSLHSLSHNQLNAVNLTFQQIQLLHRFATGKYVRADEWLYGKPKNQLEPEEEFCFAPISKTDSLGVPWNLEEYDIFDYYEELYPGHF